MDFSSQLEGTFDVLRSGVVGAKGGAHLSARQKFHRDKILATIEHKRAAGMAPAEAVTDYVRDAAFTTLNRFVALKMLEARDLVQECITKGEQSTGYREFCGMAPGLVLLPDAAGYRLYIESLLDELSTEIKVLFDRRDASSVLWPKRQTFDALLDTLNTTDLADIWREDESIGWVYQFFNSPEERDAAKRQKRVPESGREISLRSQYFTPKHVVQFLMDNTLGVIWSDMHSNQTTSGIDSAFMVASDTAASMSRELRDPRDIRVLDPACGSGHFLLYAFNLYLSFYQEAWADHTSPPSEATSRTLREDYPTKAALLAALPSLILRHNLFGVDLDVRCAQIASLALWLRAQRAYRDLEVSRGERPAIARTNIVVAAPIAAQRTVTESFLEELRPDVAGIFRVVLDEMEMAGQAGMLLRVEDKLRAAIQATVGRHGDLFRKTDEEAWASTEQSLISALGSYPGSGASGDQLRRHLFSDDVAHGLDFIDICRQRYDAVVLNPPYTEVGGALGQYLRKSYTENWTNLYSAFIERALELSRGRVGVVCSESILTGYRMRNLRQEFIEGRKLVALAPLDRLTFDGMGLPTVAFVLDRRPNPTSAVLGRLNLSGFVTTDVITPEAVSAKVDFVLTPELIQHGHTAWEDTSQLGEKYALITSGNRTFDDFRYIRMWWEVNPDAIGEYWHPWQKGGEYQPFFSSSPFVMRWNKATNGHEIRVFGVQRVGTDAQVAQSSRYWWRPGIVGPTMTTGGGFNARVLPAGQIISAKSTGIFPKRTNETFFVLGLLNSRAIRWMLFQQGAGLSGNTGKIQNLPIVEPSDGQKQRIDALSRKAVQAIAALECSRENSPYFVNPIEDCSSTESEYRSLIADLDGEFSSLFAINNFDARIPTGTDLADKAIAQATGVRSTGSDWRIVSYFFGIAMGRWRFCRRDAFPITADALFEPMPHRPPAAEVRPVAAPPLLVDDEGHPEDVISALYAAANLVPEASFDELVDRLAKGFKGGLREWVRTTFFDLHRTQYSEGRRKAPIYWQLATPTASYSIWLYAHSLTSDTLYQVQNDYVAPKLVHEERRLEAMRNEYGDKPNAGERKQLASQENFVDEIRVFLEEVKRVAALWSPNLDDGIVLNFAVLWRLVSHRASWQKELKGAWDALSSGEYDWANLAMHLWPERVVPQCVTDRSLAIAHGLEDVFWEGGANGKWKPRPIPTQRVDELIRERTSVAVKAALKGLAEASVPSGSKARTRRSSS